MKWQPTSTRRSGFSQYRLDWDADFFKNRLDGTHFARKTCGNSPQEIWSREEGIISPVRASIARYTPQVYFDIDLIPEKMWALELGSTVISNSDTTSRPGDHVFLYLSLSEIQPEKYIRVGIGYCWFNSNEISIFANAEVHTVPLV